jgi:hypothetical protein
MASVDWTMNTTTTAGPYWGNTTYVKCPHGFQSVYCYQCQNPALCAPSGVLYQMGGWTCPGCRRGYSPQVLVCPSCGPEGTGGEDFTGGATGAPVSSCCQPSAEGGLCSCDEGEDEDVCHGGRHCSC